MDFYEVNTLDVIVYGMGNSFLESECYLKERVNIVGCSDSDEGKRNCEIAKRYQFYSPKEFLGVSFDYLFIASIYDEEICSGLVEQYGIKRDKIMVRNEWSRLVFLKHGGYAYPDAYAYIVEKPIRVKSGLFSYVFSVIDQFQYLNGLDVKPVMDMQSYPNIYMNKDKVGRENAWEYYFEPLSDVKLKDVGGFQNILLGYDSPDYKTDYMQKYDIDKLHEVYKKYIHIKSDVMQGIDRECSEILPDGFEKVLGVLYRGTDMVNLKLKDHPVQPTIEEMCSLIEEYMAKWQCDTIYLCTEDAAALERFKECFPGRVACSSQTRFRNTGNKWLGELFDDMDADKRNFGRDYLTTIEILSRCNNMIASVCTGSVCAHIMHGNKYEHLLMIDKGSYK
jgi:hypothetical protein